MKKNTKKQLINLIYPLISIIVLVVCWLVLSSAVKNELIVPTIGDTITEMGKIFAQKQFYFSLLKTLLRTLIAVVVSFILAGATASLSFVFKKVGRVASPIISVIRTIPTMAVLLMILLWSTPNVAPIIVAILVLFPMIYAQFITAMNGIDQGVIDTAKIFKLSKKDKLFKIYVPMIMPHLVSNLGSNFSFGIKLIVSAEVMAYTFNSLGGMMQTASAYLNLPRLAGLTVVAVALGLIIEGVFAILVKKVFKWTRTEGDYD